MKNNGELRQANTKFTVALTKEDIKTLKYEKRFGFIMAVFILSLAALFNLVYIVSNHEINLPLLLSIDLAIIGLSLFVMFILNRNINKDLRAGAKVIDIGTIEKKKHKTDYEAGSAALYIPVLGDLFPKLCGPKMKSYSRYILVIKGAGYDVEKELFDDVMEGSPIEIHNSKYSDVFLAIKKNE